MDGIVCQRNNSSQDYRGELIRGSASPKKILTSIHFVVITYPNTASLFVVVGGSFCTFSFNIQLVCIPPGKPALERHNEPL
jgi:hypothetical protein